MNGEQNAFSIVVLGVMSPPLHHPLWYADAGILAPPEADQALRSPSFSCTAEASGFAFGAWRVHCARARWWVSTNRVDALDRMLNIAVLTHNRLIDTPVTSFGLNFAHVREVNGPDVPQVLARAALSAPLGLEAPGAVGAAIQYRRILGGAVLTVFINPTDSPRHVEVKTTYMHDLQDFVVPGQIALGELIVRDFPIAWGEAQAQLLRTLQAFDRAGRV